MYVCMHVCMYVCMYVYIYINTYPHPGIDRAWTSQRSSMKYDDD